jgi:hypothetical protein
MAFTLTSLTAQTYKTNLTALYRSLTIETDSVIAATNAKIEYLKSTEGFDGSKYVGNVVHVTPEYYVHSKELEALRITYDFKLDLAEVMITHSDSIITGLNSSVQIGSELLRIKTKESSTFENSSKQKDKLIRKQELAISNLERTAKISNRRSMLLGGTAAVAVISAIIISLTK